MSVVAYTVEKQTDMALPTVTVWIRGDRRLKKILRQIAIERDIGLIDLISQCLFVCLKDEIPEDLHYFFEQDVRQSGHSDTETDASTPADTDSK